MSCFDHLLLTKPNTRNKRKRIAAIDQDELEKITLIEGNVGAKAVKSSYESCRNDLLLILNPGDHIAAKRRTGINTYEHHGIYEGNLNGYPSVIHFQGPRTLLAKASAPLLCTFNCGYWHPKNGGTVISCIDCFSLKKKMFKMQYMLQDNLLSNQDTNWNDLKPGKVIVGYRTSTKTYYLEHKLDGKLYGHSLFSIDTHSKDKVDDRLRYFPMYSDRSAKQVLEVACFSKCRPYDLGCNNCEHFAVFSKTGVRRSIQVENSNLPISCDNGKLVCPWRRRGVQDLEYAHLNFSPEEPRKVMQAEEEEVADEQEKELLGSPKGVKRRKTSRFH